MNIHFRFLGPCLVLAALAGCGNPRTSDADAAENAYAPVLYTDHVTGCDYLSTGQTQSLTPRIAADGKTHMGCKGAQP